MLTLVTGATGLVGNNVVRLLLGRGQRVRVLHRAGSDQRPLSGLDVETALGDVRDRSAMLHAAAYVHIGWTGIELQREINVGGTQHVIDAARVAKARLVHISTVDTLG